MSAAFQYNCHMISQCGTENRIDILCSDCGAETYVVMHGIFPTLLMARQPQANGRYAFRIVGQNILRDMCKLDKVWLDTVDAVVTIPTPPRARCKHEAMNARSVQYLNHVPTQETYSHST